MRHNVAAYGSPGQLRHKFTGKERDTESNMDYFLARHYGSSIGSFTGPDIPLLDQSADSPQSWNLYGYVRNNPLVFIDPTGRCSEDGNGGYIDEGDGLFPGECAGGTIGGEEAQETTVYAYPQVDPLVAYFLRMAGDRAARDTSTFVISSAVFATAYASTYAIPAAATGLAAMGEAGAVGSGAGLLNKIHHIFGNAAYNLNGLVQQYGSPAAAYAALEEATVAQVVARGITGQFQEIVKVGGTAVTVRGAVVDGVVKIGTAFK